MEKDVVELSIVSTCRVCGGYTDKEIKKQISTTEATELVEYHDDDDEVCVEQYTDQSGVKHCRIVKSHDKHISC